MDFPVDVTGTEKLWNELKWSLLNSTKNNNTVLDSHFKKEYKPEDFVIENCLEYIVFMFINNSTVDHINDVH